MHPRAKLLVLYYFANLTSYPLKVAHMLGAEVLTTCGGGGGTCGDAGALAPPVHVCYAKFDDPDPDIPMSLFTMKGC